LLLFADLLVLLLVGGSFQALPWQPPLKKVHKDMTQRFKIIPPRLFSAKMRVDGHVPRCARQRLAFSVWNVLLGFRVSILLSHAKVDHVNDIDGFRIRSPNEEVIRLDVAVDEILLVDGLNS